MGIARVLVSLFSKNYLRTHSNETNVKLNHYSIELIYHSEMG